MSSSTPRTTCAFEDGSSARTNGQSMNRFSVMLAVAIVVLGTTAYSQQSSAGLQLDGFTKSEVERALGAPSDIDASNVDLDVWYYTSQFGTLKIHFVGGDVSNWFPKDFPFERFRAGRAAELNASPQATLPTESGPVSIDRDAPLSLKGLSAQQVLNLLGLPSLPQGASWYYDTPNRGTLKLLFVSGRISEWFPSDITLNQLGPRGDASARNAVYAHIRESKPNTPDGDLQRQFEAAAANASAQSVRQASVAGAPIARSDAAAALAANQSQQRQIEVESLLQEADAADRHADQLQGMANDNERQAKTLTAQGNRAAAYVAGSAAVLFRTQEGAARTKAQDARAKAQGIQGAMPAPSQPSYSPLAGQSNSGGNPGVAVAACADRIPANVVMQIKTQELKTMAAQQSISAAITAAGGAEAALRGIDAQIIAYQSALAHERQNQAAQSSMLGRQEVQGLIDRLNDGILLNQAVRTLIQCRVIAR